MTSPTPQECRLTGERLIVRLAEQRDAEEIARYFAANQRHLAEFFPVARELCDAALWRLRIEAQRHEFADDRSCKTFLFEQDDATVIGSANLSEFVRGPFQAAYLGYALAQAKQGQGLMHEALSMLIGFAFDGLRLHRVMANHMPRNARSAKVLDRLGFEQEGLARHYLFINGTWEDHVLTSLANAKWTPE